MTRDKQIDELRLKLQLYLQIENVAKATATFNRLIELIKGAE